MLTRNDIRIIKGMLRRGDRQSDISAFFGHNIGRVSEVNTGQREPDVPEAPLNELPPPGPYMAARSAIRAKQTLEAVRDLITDALNDIESWERIEPNGS